MKAKLIFGMPSDGFDRIFPKHVLEALRNTCDVVDAPLPAEVGPGFFKRHAADAEILVTSWGTPDIDEEILRHGEQIKLIAHAAGTVKQLATNAVWKRGIRVTSSAAAMAVGVAEFCLGLMITCSKRAFWLCENIRRGAWSREVDLFGAPFELYRQNVGVIGASMVGKRLIDLLQPFGCNVMVYDPYCSAEELLSMHATKIDTLDELFARCRVVSLNAPTTDETIGMIRGHHFARLPDGALFINTARGVIIDQAEMIDELRKGRFVACLDVTNPEPPLLDDPLRRLPNVLLTPHEAGAVAENLMRIGEFVASEVAVYQKGEALRGEVTKKRLSTMA